MQGVSALKGLEGPFLFGAMGPLPAGAAPLGRAARARLFCIGLMRAARSNSSLLRLSLTGDQF
jgi:hypothetical protein